MLSSYRYNGLGYRIIERTGTSGTPTRFIYDDRWRIAATYEGSATTPKKRLVHHCAGLAGFGGSSYIDSVILQDADEAGDSTLETRTYTLQNWRADVAVAAKVGTSGAFVCRGYVVYEAYGKAISYPLNSADFNGDDGVDDLDNTAFYAAFSNGDPEADLNLDDAIDDLDITAWNAIFQSGVTKEPGSGALSGLLVGYAGYMRDGFDDDLYHVRHRVYDTELGRWTRRDSLGYVDGMSVYEYVGACPLVFTDATGLMLATPPDRERSLPWAWRPSKQNCDHAKKRINNLRNEINDRIRDIIVDRLGLCKAFLKDPEKHEELAKLAGRTANANSFMWHIQQLRKLQTALGIEYIRMLIVCRDQKPPSDPPPAADLATVRLGYDSVKKLFPDIFSYCLIEGMDKLCSVDDMLNPNSPPEYIGGVAGACVGGVIGGLVGGGVGGVFAPSTGGAAPAIGITTGAGNGAVKGCLIGGAAGYTVWIWYHYYAKRFFE